MKLLLIIMMPLLGIVGAVSAQKINELEKQSKSTTIEQSEDNIQYNGFTKQISFERMIPPHGLEVTYDKTVHIIFPATVKYVDLGSSNLIAGKVSGAENVIRIKSSVRDFKAETNLAVITEDGNFYTFNVKYSDEPTILNIEMKDFIHDGSIVNRPNNSMEIYMSKLGQESPKLVSLIMQSIYKNNKKDIKYIGCKRFGIIYSMKGMYSYNDFLYFHTEIKNESNVPFDIDFLTFKIVDKKVMKRTTIQEQIITPLRSYNHVTNVFGKSRERSVFTFEKFTIPKDKQLIVELKEKDGGRHQSFIISSYDILRAKTIDELKTN